MPQSDRAHRYRPTALDRALASSRTVVTIGPLAHLDEHRVRAKLVSALGATAAQRLALEPRTDDPVWQYRSDVEEPVVRRWEPAADDLGLLVTQIHDRPGPRGALELFVCGDYLIADYSHGIGDGLLGTTLLAVLSGDVDASQAATLTAELPPRAASHALLRHYRSRPGAIREFLRLRRNHKTRSDDRSTTEQQDVRRTLAESELGKQSVTAYMAADKVTELRSWARTNAGDASTAAVTVALWMAALGATGVPVDERVMILVNCRRYLDPKYAAAQGNFAVGIPVLLPRPGTPQEINEVIRDVVDSGWPIAVLGMAEVKSAIKRSAPVAPARSTDVGTRLRCAVSDLGRLPMFDHTEWLPGRPPQLVAYLDPDGADAATLLVSELVGVRTFTVSFCSGMVDPGLIAEALDRMCADPVGTLVSALR